MLILKYIFLPTIGAMYACIEILKVCRAAIRPGGKFVIVGLALGEPGEPVFGTLWRHGHFAGGHRRAGAHGKRIEALLKGGGFKLTAIPTMSPCMIYEAVPV